MSARTLYDKLWDDHVVHTEEDGTSVLYIDRHLVHEVTSPQAFEGLRLAGRKVWRTSSIVATADHNTPTTGWERGYDGIVDPISKQQVITLDANIKAFGAAAYFPFLDKRQGIVHVIGPEQGATLPGMTVVCGDSHTSTHGAFGALAHGIGTSEVEHVMATQTLLAKKAKNLLVKVEGQAAARRDRQGHRAGHHRPHRHRRRHRLHHRIRRLGHPCAQHGRAHDGVQHGHRGRRARRAGGGGRQDAGLRKGRPFAPTGVEWEQAVAYWRTLHSDPGAHFDAVVELDAAQIRPQVTWGTSPEMVLSIEDRVPDPDKEKDAVKRGAIERALAYMGLEPNKPLADVHRGQGVHRLVHQQPHRGPARCRGGGAAGSAARSRPNVKLAMVVPGSGLVKAQAEAEGLDKVFKAAGFEWREPGCSHVPGDERRPAGARRALRLHQQPQLRRTPGQRRTHAPGQPGHGRGRRAAGPLRRCAPPRLIKEQWT